MSQLMKDVCWLLRVKQVQTSAYHPQTDGLVEHFIQTLKRLLRQVIIKEGQNWDRLPYILFSVSETPQVFMGFTPFKLLFGRWLWDLLSIAKEAWEE